MNFDEISKRVKKFGKDTVEEVQKMNEVRQLNGKVSDAKKQIDTLYVEMGKRLYEQYKDAPFAGFETEIQTINEKNELIEQLKKQIREVKGVVLCPCCNMEVAEGERFCSNCGNKMPVDETDGDAVDAAEETAGESDEPDPESWTEEQPEEAEEETAETAAETAEAADTAAEAAEAVGEAADTVAEAAEAVGEAADTVTEAAEAVGEAAEEAAETAAEATETEETTEETAGSAENEV